MSKFQKAVSNEDEQSHLLKSEIDFFKKQLSTEKKEKKAEINLLKIKHDSKVSLMTEEISTLKAQCSKYRRQSKTYQEMVEGVQKNRGNVKVESDKEKISELQIQLHVRIIYT